MPQKTFRCALRTLRSDEPKMLRLFAVGMILVPAGGFL
ncbi:hypothetical protein CA85_23020 [Allorhodopirellula solitaria]|uniref:Uncharacterized protein n=1 Tax=Allorhodopirellula solitaria TaxID=2527987 RepID=A0A5C5XY53_9BACT|nr:hypothetical protein CA85_23020 [Allorhodopirellula solitaria]